MRRLLCKLFGHRRDGRHAHPIVGGWRTTCRHCGIRLDRVAPGEWRPVSPGQRLAHGWASDLQPFPGADACPPPTAEGGDIAA